MNHMYVRSRTQLNAKCYVIPHIAKAGSSTAYQLPLLNLFIFSSPFPLHSTIDDAVASSAYKFL